MKANLMGRTAIGLLAFSTTLQVAAAESCSIHETRETVEPIEEMEAPAHGLPDCTVKVRLRGRLNSQETVILPPPVAASTEFTRSHLVVNSTLPDAIASGRDSVAIGGQAVAEGEQAVAVGPSAHAVERASIAFGASANARAAESIAFGNGAMVHANALGGLAIGSAASVAPDATHAMALGAFSGAEALRSVALGYSARSEAENAVALGSFSSADQEFTISVGRADNPITSRDETLLRRITNLAAGSAVTVAVNLDQMQAALAAAGTGTDYLATNGTGPAAAAPGTNAIALGVNTRAGAGNSVAIGTGAQALFSDSFAFGYAVQTARNNQFMFGKRASNYAMPGLVNPQSRQLQTGPLELVTVDSDGTLAGDGGQTVAALYGEITDNADRIDLLNNRVGENAAGIFQNASDIEMVQASIDRVEQDLTQGLELSENNAGEIVDLREDVSSNRSEIQQNAGAIRSNRASISANTASIQRLEEESSGTGVRFEDIESQMADQERRMDGVDQTLTVHAEQIVTNTETSETALALAGENQERIARTQASMVDQTESIAMLHSDFENLGLSVYGLAQVVANQADKIDSNKSGVAIATALAGSSWLQANETAAFTLNAGYFEGSSALAFSGAKRLDDKWSANIAIGAAPDRGEIGARAGLRLGW